MKFKIKTSLGREFEYNADHNTKAAEKSGQETLQVQKKGAIVGLFGVLVRLLVLEAKEGGIC